MGRGNGRRAAGTVDGPRERSTDRGIDRRYYGTVGVRTGSIGCRSRPVGLEIAAELVTVGRGRLA